MEIALCFVRQIMLQSVQHLFFDADFLCHGVTHAKVGAPEFQAAIFSCHDYIPLALGRSAGSNNSNAFSSIASKDISYAAKQAGVAQVLFSQKLNSDSRSAHLVPGGQVRDPTVTEGENESGGLSIDDFGDDLPGQHSRNRALDAT
jgi:hypothetical protein